MQEPKTWRELLGSLDSQEKRHIVKHLGIQSKTLDRWIRGVTETPRPAKIQKLCTLLNDSRKFHFMELLRQDPEVAGSLSLPHQQLIPREIPSAFYARILETNASTSGPARFAALCQFVSLQLISLFGGTQVGIGISIFLCTPTTKKICSLRNYISMGSYPWDIVDQSGFFVGAESEVGKAIREYQVRKTTREKFHYLRQDIHQDDCQNLTVVHEERVRSLAVLCIQHEDRLAGALQVVSTQSQFFTKEHLDILRKYVHLLLIGIEDTAFYRQEKIELGVMPHFEVQKEELAAFQKSLSDVVKQVNCEERPKIWAKAEQQKLVELEEKLLSMALQSR